MGPPKFAQIFAQIFAQGFIHAQDRLWQIILSFNLGVELGQLAVAFAILGLFALAKHYFSQSYYGSIHNFTGAVVFSMGTFWFVTRAMGI